MHIIGYFDVFNLIVMRKFLLLLIFFSSLNLIVRGQDQVLDSLINTAKNHPMDSVRQLAYNRIFAHTYFSLPDTARYYAKEKVALSQTMGHLSQEGEAYKYIGITFAVQGVLDSSLYYYEQSLEIAHKLEDSLSVCYNLHNIGYTLWKMNLYPEALEKYFESLSIKEKLLERGEYTKADLKLGGSFENIGIVYSSIGDSVKAYHNYLKARDKYAEAEDAVGLGQVSSNIGTYFSQIGKYDSAYYYYKQALESFYQTNNIYGQSVCFNNIASYFYKHKKNYDSAAYYFEQAVAKKKQINDLRGLSQSITSLGGVRIMQGRYIEAQQLLYEAYKIAQDLNLTGGLADYWYNQMRLDTAVNNYKKAFFSRVNYDSLQQQIDSKERLAAIDDLEAKYESVKKEKQIAELNRQKAEQDKELIERRNWLLITILGLLFAVIVTMVQFRTVRFKSRTNHLLKLKNSEITNQKEEIEAQSEELRSINENLNETIEELNQRNEEISTQRDMLEKQKQLIEQINLDLTDSIQYARNIQQAMLPELSKIRQHIPDLLVYLNPRDIVSGDFYWFFHHEGKSIIIAADCTGHGVPGAFMSTLGNDLLHEAVVVNQLLDPAKILDALNLGVRRVLKQETTSNKDGMDMAICMIDHRASRLIFAGAKNPLLYFEAGEMKLIKGTNNPVGGEIRKEPIPYINHVIDIKPTTTFYIYSDGFQDQFGGEKGKKFMSGNFRLLLQEIHKNDFDMQYQKLKEKFQNWKASHPQVDDVLIVGFRV